ncbi:MAG: DUF2905 domain-containing protein [Firmicutes bacterium]|nr:DUF2905 domain-containing protein [Bacillota bacterium]
MPAMGRMLVILGIFLILIGIGLSLGPRLPWLGRLPGDIVIKREGFTFYFPLATCVLVSLILSLLARIFNR